MSRKTSVDAPVPKATTASNSESCTLGPPSAGDVGEIPNTGMYSLFSVFVVGRLGKRLAAANQRTYQQPAVREEVVCVVKPANNPIHMKTKTPQPNYPKDRKRHQGPLPHTEYR